MNLISFHGNIHTPVELHSASLRTTTLNTTLQDHIAILTQFVSYLDKK